MRDLGAWLTESSVGKSSRTSGARRARFVPARYWLRYLRELIPESGSPACAQPVTRFKVHRPGKCVLSYALDDGGRRRGRISVGQTRMASCSARLGSPASAHCVF